MTPFALEVEKLRPEQPPRFPAKAFEREVAQILRLSGSRSEITFRPLPTDDPKVRQPDIGKARRLLGWEPVVDVEEGLRRTIEWYRQSKMAR